MALKKDVIKRVMYNYLESFGYPDFMSKREIVQEHLVPMFEILLDAKLVGPQHFRPYIKAAIYQYNLSVANTRRHQ